MERKTAVCEAAQVLPQELYRAVCALSSAQLEQGEELRLRRGRPPALVAAGREWDADCRGVVEEDLLQVVEQASQASAHTVVDQLRQGFVTLRGGHRIGLCGTMARRQGEGTTLRHLGSIAIRVACPVEGVAEGVVGQLWSGTCIHSTLLLAPPGAGKTTLLRDLVRTLSEGGGGRRPLRVGLADERGEVAAMWQGAPQFSVGCHTDVMDGCSKAEGLSMLLRGMNPQVLAVDEITHPSDAAALEEAAGCGVALLATAHGSGREDLERRPVYRRLLEGGVFRRLVTLRCQEGVRRYQVEGLA